MTVRGYFWFRLVGFTALLSGAVYHAAGRDYIHTFIYGLLAGEWFDSLLVALREYANEIRSRKPEPKANGAEERL